MQHPDEGTIHSWLDNALSAEEAARVESHVAECPQCAAAVAEARGFIAASSRILTALDDVPRGVVPAIPARKRDLRVLWRAAAAVLVVAGGSFIVMRDGGEATRSSIRISDSVSADAKASVTAVEAGGKAEAGAPAAAPGSDASVASVLTSKRRATFQTARPSEARTSVDRPLSVKAPPQTVSIAGRIAGAEASRVDSAAPIARTNAPTNEVQLSGIVATEQSGPASLKELNVESTPGSRRIVYQISPTDTVTLTERAIVLREYVTTGVASAQDRQQTAGRTRAVAPLAAEPAAAAPPLVAPSVNTITWIEVGTGKTLTLAGKLSVERLQEIKRRIEIERAAATKKNP